jgi:hypothetical protein
MFTTGGIEQAPLPITDAIWSVVTLLVFGLNGYIADVGSGLFIQHGPRLLGQKFWPLFDWFKRSFKYTIYKQQSTQRKRKFLEKAALCKYKHLI